MVDQQGRGLKEEGREGPETLGSFQACRTGGRRGEGALRAAEDGRKPRRAGAGAAACGGRKGG